MTTASFPKYVETLIAQDHELVRICKEVHILADLSWPVSMFSEFKKGLAAGSPQLPIPTYPQKNYRERRTAVRALQKKIDTASPLGAYLGATAESFQVALALLDNTGGKRFSELSTTLYGAPSLPLGANGVTLREVAAALLEATKDFAFYLSADSPEYCIPADVARNMIENEASAVFGENVVSFVVEKSLLAKAAAGAKRVRLRGEACFSENDIKQLIQHEAFVHTLTLRNGRQQPHIQCLGLGAPRTTSTQEGIAVLAELATCVIDISRLRRIALRVIAIDNALQGADFLDVYRFFVDHGGDEFESFQSAARIFRGGTVTGGNAFTKDISYLAGLLQVYIFFRKCVIEGHPYLLEHLFAGRMTLSDVITLEPYFENAVISKAQLLPPWITSRSTLLAFLAFGQVFRQIELSGISLQNFVDDPADKS